MKNQYDLKKSAGLPAVIQAFCAVLYRKTVRFAMFPGAGILYIIYNIFNSW